MLERGKQETSALNDYYREGAYKVNIPKLLYSCESRGTVLMKL